MQISTRYLQFGQSAGIGKTVVLLNAKKSPIILGWFDINFNVQNQDLIEARRSVREKKSKLVFPNSPWP